MSSMEVCALWVLRGWMRALGFNSDVEVASRVSECRPSSSWLMVTSRVTDEPT